MPERTANLLGMKRPALWLIAFFVIFCIIFSAYFIFYEPRVFMTLYYKDKYIHGIAIEDAGQQRYVTDAINGFHKKSGAKPGINVNCLENVISISVQRGLMDKEGTVYYVFELNGKPCMQNGSTNKYNLIQDNIYLRLKELAYGYYQPYALTVVSGENTINAAGHTLWHNDKVNGVCADMEPFTPSEVEDLIRYIRIDAQNEVMPTFFVKGKEVYGKYTFYDENFSEIPYSGSFNDLEQGKYIAELLIDFDISESSFGMQYFFGVTVP